MPWNGHGDRGRRPTRLPEENSSRSSSNLRRPDKQEKANADKKMLWVDGMDGGGGT